MLCKRKLFFQIDNYCKLVVRAVSLVQLINVIEEIVLSLGIKWLKEFEGEREDNNEQNFDEWVQNSEL